MADIGFHASHEQFSPSELLKFARLAEEAGFQAVNCSDHFKPWSKRQGQSGFSFAWLGAAMQASQLPFGVVCAPGYRHHPAIVAQAVATLCEMFPGRFWISLGSGEAMNERITGKKWPAKQERNDRLHECAMIIKRLLRGETVNHEGLVTVEDAKLYTLPKVQPLILGAAVTKETAGWLGTWADGMITINHPIKELKEIVAAFRQGGNKPVYVKCQLSYAKTNEAALIGAHDQWRTNVFSGTVLSDLWMVEQFDAAAEFVQPEALKKMVLISSDIQYFKEMIDQYIELGINKIILHNVNRDQERFINDFGEKLLPGFR